MAEWQNGGMVEWQLNGGMDSTYVAISAILPFCHSFCRLAIPAITAIRPFRLPYRHSVCHSRIYFCCGLRRSYINSWLRSLHACICNFFHSVNNSHIMTNSWIYQYCTILHCITNDITNADFRAVGPIGLSFIIIKYCMSCITMNCQNNKITLALRCCAITTHIIVG